MSGRNRVGSGAEVYSYWDQACRTAHVAKVIRRIFGLSYHPAHGSRRLLRTLFGVCCTKINLYRRLLHQTRLIILTAQRTLDPVPTSVWVSGTSTPLASTPRYRLLCPCY
jgi:hypothetical protein